MPAIQVGLSFPGRSLSHSKVGACTEHHCNAERNGERKTPVYPERRKKKKGGDRQCRKDWDKTRGDLVAHGPIPLMRHKSRDPHLAPNPFDGVMKSTQILFFIEINTK